MAKSVSGKYQGSLSLEWFNKQKAILLQGEADAKKECDIPAPRINWINRDDALFYEIDEEEGKGLSPYWVDRNDIRVKEARPLVFKKAYIAEAKDKADSLLGMDVEYKVKESKNAVSGVQNILVKGDNLLSLNSIRRIIDHVSGGEGVKCIYIDPPYNTGKAFANYDDNMEHSEWLSLMRDRLVVLRSLLQDDGMIFVQLDDSEGPYGKVLLDDVFGRDCFLVTIYVQVRYEDKTLKEDMLFNKVIEQVHVYKKSTITPVAINRDAVEYTDEKFCYEISVERPSEVLSLGGRKVEVYKPDTYSIKKGTPSRQRLKEIWASGSILDGNSSGRFFRDFLSGREQIDGLGCLYKVDGIGDDGLGYRFFTGPKREGASRGKYYQGMPLIRQSEEESVKYVPISNFMDFAPDVGNCRHEGGVEFNSGKKPEKLMKKILEMATDPGDLVLDCFGGSGTTPAVAHKMKRRWISVEIGDHADTHIIGRLKKVIDGTDRAGVSEAVNWQGGGAFSYYHLGSSIINVDKKTGKGEFNWKLGRKFLQESLLQSYDFVPDATIKFSQYLAGDTPAIGRLESLKGVIFGVAWLVAPEEPSVSIDAETVQALYNAIKAHKPRSIHVFTNKGWDIKQDAMPPDMEIVKVPHAIFAELER